MVLQFLNKDLWTKYLPEANYENAEAARKKSSSLVVSELRLDFRVSAHSEVLYSYLIYMLIIQSSSFKFSKKGVY